MGLGQPAKPASPTHLLFLSPPPAFPFFFLTLYTPHLPVISPAVIPINLNQC